MRWLSSVDGMRFYVPVNLLAADYSPILQGMGVTLLAHTSDSYLRPFQQPILKWTPKFRPVVKLGFPESARREKVQTHEEKAEELQRSLEGQGWT